MAQFVPQISRVAAAITISRRMVAVLAAAWHFAERLNAPLLVIHGGAPDAQKEAEFRDFAENTANLIHFGQRWLDFFYLFEQRQLIAEVLHPFAQLVPKFIRRRRSVGSLAEKPPSLAISFS
jgi:hypothetical protein